MRRTLSLFVLDFPLSDGATRWYIFSLIFFYTKTCMYLSTINAQCHLTSWSHVVYAPCRWAISVQWQIILNLLQQRMAQEVLTHLKEHPDAWTRVDTILEFSQNMNTKVSDLKSANGLVWWISLLQCRTKQAIIHWGIIMDGLTAGEFSSDSMLYLLLEDMKYTVQ